MRKTGINFSFDEDAEQFFKGFGKKLDEAKTNAVEVAGMVWADKAKLITQADHHIDTGAYVNSIGHETHIQGPNGSDVGTVIHDLTRDNTKTKLVLGSGVDYAAELEKRYNIFGRALDSSLEEMGKVGHAAIKKTLGG